MRSPARISVRSVHPCSLRCRVNPFWAPAQGDRPSCRRPIRARRGLRHLPSRPAVMRRRGGLRLRCTASDGRTGGGAVGGRTGGTRRSEAGRRRAAVAGSGSSPLFGTLPVRGGAAFGGGACRTGVDPAACRCCDVRAFAAADASCGCCALAEIALRTAYGAGFRQGDVWLIADDAEVFARYGGRSSKVPLCGLSPEGTGRGGVRGLFLHRMRVGSKSDVKRLRKGGRRIVVWDVNSAGDAAAMRAYGVDFIVTDDPESIGGR